MAIVAAPTTAPIPAPTAAPIAISTWRLQSILTGRCHAPISGIQESGSQLAIYRMRVNVWADLPPMRKRECLRPNVSLILRGRPTHNIDDLSSWIGHSQLVKRPGACAHLIPCSCMKEPILVIRNRDGYRACRGYYIVLLDLSKLRNRITHQVDRPNCDGQ